MLTTAQKRVIRQEWFSRGPVHCHWCRKRLDQVQRPRNGNFCTIDHLLEIALGGTDDFANLVPACADCNVRRSDKVNPEVVACNGRNQRATLDHKHIGGRLG